MWDGRYASQDPPSTAINVVPYTISTPIRIRSAFFLRRTQLVSPMKKQIFSSQFYPNFCSPQKRTDVPQKRVTGSPPSQGSPPEKLATYREQWETHRIQAMLSRAKI